MYQKLFRCQITSAESKLYHSFFVWILIYFKPNKHEQWARNLNLRADNITTPYKDSCLISNIKFHHKFAPDWKKWVVFFFCQFLYFPLKIVIPAKGYSVRCLGLSVIKACQQSESIQIYFLLPSKAINKNPILTSTDWGLSDSSQDLVR